MSKNFIDKTKIPRPENMIIGTDPVSIDILRQIYGAIYDKSDERRSFLEKCWMMGIEKIYQNPSIKLDPDLFFKLLEQIYQHLENKNIWEAKEEELYEIFEKIISLKTRKDTSLKDVFDNLEKSVTATLQLDFSHKVPLHEAFKDKRNIFNYIVLLINTVIEKMEISTVSTKAVNSYFSKLPDTVFIVTDNAGRIRFMNQLGERLLELQETGYLGLEAKERIKDYATLIEKLNKNGEVENFKSALLSTNKKSKSIPVSISIPETVKDRSEIEEIAFIIKINKSKFPKRKVTKKGA